MRSLRCSLVLVLVGVSALVALGCGEDPIGTGGGGAGSTADASSTSGTEATTSGSASSTSSDASSSASSGTGGKLPTCDGYPVELTLPDTSAAALADLQTFAPGATLQWSALHGTLSLVTNLGVTLDCASDPWTAAWKVLEAHPALFQLDQSEWQAQPPFPCSIITSNTIVNTYRDKLAGVGVQKDVLALVLGPLPGGGVELRGVSGFYLPVLQPGDLDACPNIDDAIMKPILRQGPYGFSTFSMCTPTGSGMYTPKPNDTLVLDGETWEWDDSNGGIIARKRRSARLIIHESNYTDELMASDANCPDETGDERVLGFVINYDPVTGEIFYVKPGIGCIVC